jgi:hypothetical protein
MPSPTLQEFVTAARAFCSLAELAVDAPSDETDLWRIRELLLRLMYHIPAVDGAPHSLDGETVSPDDALQHQAAQKFVGFPFNFYRTVYDPHDLEDEDPFMGFLSDDLGDIYHDLYQGLSLVEQNQMEAACWHWSFSYRTHWGPSPRRCLNGDRNLQNR